MRIDAECIFRQLSPDSGFGGNPCRSSRPSLFILASGKGSRSPFAFLRHQEPVLPTVLVVALVLQWAYFMCESFADRSSSFEEPFPCLHVSFHQLVERTIAIRWVWVDLYPSY